MNVEEDEEFGCASSEKDFGLGRGFGLGFCSLHALQDGFY